MSMIYAFQGSFFRPNKPHLLAGTVRLSLARLAAFPYLPHTVPSGCTSREANCV
jgi:hypothetical protein